MWPFVVAKSCQHTISRWYNIVYCTPEWLPWELAASGCRHQAMLVFYSSLHWLWRSRGSSYTLTAPLWYCGCHEETTHRLLFVHVNAAFIVEFHLAGLFIVKIHLAPCLDLLLQAIQQLPISGWISEVLPQEWNKCDGTKILLKFLTSKYCNPYAYTYHKSVDPLQSELVRFFPITPQHSSALLHSVQFSYRWETQDWSFGWRWRIDHYCAQCPLCWSPMAQKPASKREGLI